MVQHTANAPRHLKNNCDEEGLNSVIDLLQAVESKDTKNDEESSEKEEQFHLEK